MPVSPASQRMHSMSCWMLSLKPRAGHPHQHHRLRVDPIHRIHRAIMAAIRLVAVGPVSGLRWIRSTTRCSGAMQRILNARCGFRAQCQRLCCTVDGRPGLRLSKARWDCRRIEMWQSSRPYSRGAKITWTRTAMMSQSVRQSHKVARHGASSVAIAMTIRQATVTEISALAHQRSQPPCLRCRWV